MSPVAVQSLHAVVALAVVAVLVARRRRARWLGGERGELRALRALAVAAGLVYLGFFSFHGHGAWVHQHDVAHYYLGSKYFPELGYGRLYVAAVRAEAEQHGGNFRALHARDLETGEVVHIRELLARSGPVRARFSDERWRAFERDVDLFRERNAAQHGVFLRDHGFNPTPVWAMVGGALANLVPAGSAAGIRALTLLDPILLLVVGLAVRRTFGSRAALLATILFCGVFGAGFVWTGGAFLRFLWFAAAGASLALLAAGRPAASGAALAFAASLRVFPALLLWGFLADAARGGGRERGPARESARLLAGFGLGGLAIFAISAALGPGLASWAEFAANLRTQMGLVASNEVGLRPLLGALGLRNPITLDAVRLAVAAAFVVVSWRAAPRLSSPERWTLGVPLVFVLLSLPGYYWALLALVLPALLERGRLLVALFALEAICWAAWTLLPVPAGIFPLRNALFALLLVGITFALYRGSRGGRAASSRPEAHQAPQASSTPG